jgi:Zn-dependent protease
MESLNAGCIRLFKVAGITVLLHWSWFLVAWWEIQQRGAGNRALAWNVAEYLALFGIVLMHEFGHALACRQVGGKAERIVLWPLGGVAFVSPPPRPGALLWSIAAGPLVNVLLVPVTFGAAALVHHACPPEFVGQAEYFCERLAFINGVLLVFNLLPVYPLDGGQILHALLWFVIGRARSLQVSSVVGMLAAAAGFVLAVLYVNHNTWYIVLSLFVGWQALSGWKQARTLLWLEPAVDHLGRGMVSLRQGAAAEAIAECDKALGLIPEGQRARANVYLVRGLSHGRLGHYAAAEADLLQSLGIDPKNTAAMDKLAWLWATCPEPQYRHGEQAVQYATEACQATGWKEPSYLGTLAAALAEAGHFDMAVARQQKALENVDYQRQQGQQAYERIRLYQAGKPYREATKG